MIGYVDVRLPKEAVPPLAVTVSVLPAVKVAPDGPLAMFSIGGTRNAAWPAHCGYHIFSAFHAPRATGERKY